MKFRLIIYSGNSQIEAMTSYDGRQLYFTKQRPKDISILKLWVVPKILKY